MTRTLRRSSAALALSAAALAAACSSAGSTPNTAPTTSSSTTASASSAPARATRDADVITQAELSRSSASNAYDALTAIRPTFLRPRGTQSINYQTGIIVYVDEQRYGGLETLRNISTSDVVSIRRLTGTQAQARFGTQESTAGALLVITRKGGKEQ